MISIKIDSVNKLTVTITAIITERDFEKEYFFRMCCVVTNLVTSLEFKPFGCATTLCHFVRTGNGYVASRFIPLSSTAGSSATIGCVVVSERFIQREVRASRNEERVRFVPAKDLFNAICKHM